LEADALEIATLGSYTNSFIFPGVAKFQPKVALSLQKLSCEVVIVRNLEPGGFQIGPNFDYLPL
jgi:hypothetical protein